jgi:ATP-dependent helicase HrpA
MRHELVVALVRALPKGLRRGLVPAPQTATTVLARIGPQDGSLLPLLARELTRIGGTPVSVSDWRGVRLPDHLRVRYRVIDQGRVLTHGNDLSALRNGFAQHIRQSLTRITPLTQHSGLTDWTIGSLQKSLTVSRNGLELQTYPSLIDEGGTVGVRALPTRAEQREAMWLGTRRLLRLALSNPARMIDSHLDRSQKLALSQAPHADVSTVLEDCLACVIDAIVVDHGGPAWDAETFAGLRHDVRERAPRLVALTAKVTADIATRSQAVRGRLAEPAPPGLQAGRNDVARHLGRLVYPGFIAATGGTRIGRVPRYVQGMLVRLDAMGRSPQRDADGMSLVHDLEEEHRLLRTLRADQGRELNVIRWQLEELRISVFAQSLGTAERVSEARVRKALADVRQRSVAR